MNYGLKAERAKAEESIEKMNGYDMVKTAGNFLWEIYMVPQGSSIPLSSIMKELSSIRKHSV